MSGACDGKRALAVASVFAAFVTTVGVSTATAQKTVPQFADAIGASVSIPTLNDFYILPLADSIGPRVRFVQNKDVVTATWMTAEGAVYGVGTYRWDDSTRSFNGTSTTSGICADEEGGETRIRNVAIREELHVTSESTLRDRWMKPLRVDCTVGVVEVFKWHEQDWIASDKDWKPLRPRSEW